MTAEWNMIPLLVFITVPPFGLLLLWIASKAHRPHHTTLEQLVRLLSWLSRWFLALSEGLDAGLNCYRDSMIQPVRSGHAERTRRIREAAHKREEEPAEAPAEEPKPVKVPFSIAKILLGLGRRET